MFTGKFTEHTLLPDFFESDSGQVVYKEEDVVIHFWGELYNRETLGFEASTNEALIVREMLKQGKERFAELDGAFTFIVFLPDRMMIVRDHHGCGPQVYYNQNYFASSLALLQETGSCSTTVNPEALSAFLMFGYIPTPFCALQDTNKLGAGEVLTRKNNSNRVEKLFKTDNIKSIPLSGKHDLEELSSRYGELHRDAIRRRIGNSQKVGILLSGGYDSGANLAALRQIYTGDIHSYSIGFKGDNWSELPQARCMSETFRTQHHEYEIDGSEIKALPEIVKFLGDPFVEGGLMVNYSAMKMIGDQKMEVILGGDGSDQYFGTSGREVAMHYLIRKYGMTFALESLFSILDHSLFERDSTLYRIRFHLDKVLNIFQGDRFGFPDHKLKEILHHKDDIFISTPVKMKAPDFDTLYTKHLYETDIKRIIDQVILFKASRMAEMFNNRLTFPYMDSSLYQFLMQLPVTYKCKGDSVKDIAKGHGISKFLLKHHYKPMLPEAITNKKKQGGFAPMPIFFKDKRQRELLTDYILDSSIVQDFLQKDAVEKFLRQYDREADLPGKWFWYQQSKAIQFFNLLTLSVWWEIFIRKNTTFIE